MTQIPTVMTIAGSDPTSGAGLQSDLHTFSVFGVHGRSVVTAITAQTNDRVLGVWPTAGDVLTQQLATAAQKCSIDAVKVGMLATAANVLATVWFLRSQPHGHVVVDPLLHSSSGLPLLDKSAIPIFRQQLLPQATVITPNIPEAMALAGMQITSPEAMEKAAKSIHDEVFRLRGGGEKPLYVVIKGGHLKHEPIDVIFDGTNIEQLPGQRLPGGIHGSGCRYASAIAASLARGTSIRDAVATAKSYVTELIKKGEKDPV